MNVIAGADVIAKTRALAGHMQNARISNRPVRRANVTISQPYPTLLNTSQAFDQQQPTQEQEPTPPYTNYTLITHDPTNMQSPLSTDSVFQHMVDALPTHQKDDTNSDLSSSVEAIVGRPSTPFANLLTTPGPPRTCLHGSCRIQTRRSRRR